jgi:hypothetical protein
VNEAEAAARAIPVPTYGRRWHYRMDWSTNAYGSRRVSAKRYNFYLPHAAMWARVWEERTRRRGVWPTPRGWQ